MLTSIPRDLFLTTVLLFIAGVAAHATYLYLFRPKKTIVTVFVFALVVPFITLLFFESSDRLILGGLLIVILGCAFIQAFPGIQADCPTAVMMSEIAKSSHGMTYDEIQALMSTRGLLTDRIDDLEHDSLVYRESMGRLVLKPMGKFLGWAFHGYRKLLGLPRGLG